MSKDFWNLPVNPVWRVPGFMKGGGRQITSVATPFYCPLSPNSQTSEFLIYSFYTFKKILLEVVAIGRKNAGWESDSNNILQYLNHE